MPHTTPQAPQHSGADQPAAGSALAPSSRPRIGPRSAKDQQRGRVRAAIVHDLSTMERLCLMLWHAEGMSPDEIGCVLDLSPAQVSALHDRVVERLRRGLRAA